MQCKSKMCVSHGGNFYVHSIKCVQKMQRITIKFVQSQNCKHLNDKIMQKAFGRKKEKCVKLPINSMYSD